MKRLFLSLPDPLPDRLDSLTWRLPGGDPEHGLAHAAAELPAADEIWLALPAARVLLSEVALSRSALRQLNGALANALEDRLMLDPASVHVALGQARTETAHSVAVVESAWLEQVLACCRQWDIAPAGAIPETLLWQGAAVPEQWCARWQGHAGFVRTGDCAGYALDDGDAGTPPMALQLAIAEARQAGVAPNALSVESSVAIDADAWSRSLGCSILPAPLRADTRPPAINLLQGAYAARRKGWLGAFAARVEFARYRLAAGLMLAALGVHLLGTLIDWARLSWENRRLRAEMAQVFKETFPETQAIVDPALQMRRQLSTLRRARGYLEAGDFLHALNAGAGQLGGVAGLQYSSGRLLLTQPLATDREGLRARLASQGYQMAASGERDIIIERSQP